MNETIASTPRSGSYRTIWRWHFYAGLFCIPFVLWLATTGALYLFKPQVEAWLERPYENLAIAGAPASPEAQVAAALAAVPGSVLNAYELPRTPHSAVRVLVGRGATVTRVYLHPQTLQVLGRVDEESRLMRVIFKLHGELLLGARGSYLVELAASWAIVMILTGLYLWWPRGSGGLAGLVYPRLRRGGRVFWRDLHAVVGLWVSAFALFLLVSGLPWASFWGGNLKALRELGASAPLQQDWTTGSAEDRARALAQNQPDEHAAHHAMDMDIDMPMDMPMEMPAPEGRYAALDRLVPAVAALDLPPPVLIAPPSKASAQWTARSDTQDRPRRVNLLLDPQDARVVSRKGYADQPLIDRMVAVGVAAHEGQLFGWLNQLLGLCTALGLVTLSASALVLWWKRRPAGRLGAPAGAARPAAALVALIVLLGLLLPLLGLSLVAVLLAERLVLRRIAPVRDFLGLAG